MPDRPSLAAERRTVTGKEVARLRRAGRLPAVVFGHGRTSESVSLDAHEFELLRRHTGATALVDLRVDGGKALPVLLHGVQVHPVSRSPLHVDLFAVRMTEEITVEVPLVVTGTAPAVEAAGGTLLHMLESVKVKALPGDLPQSIEYSVDGLVDFEAAVHVRDLTIPAGSTLLTDPEELVARVQAPRVEIEPEPEAAAVEAEAEAAEGGAPEAAPGGESGAEAEAAG